MRVVFCTRDKEHLHLSRDVTHDTGVSYEILDNNIMHFSPIYLFRLCKH